MTRLRAKAHRLDKKKNLKRKAVKCLYENTWNCVSQTTSTKHLPSKAPDRQNMTNSFPGPLLCVTCFRQLAFQQYGQREIPVHSDAAKVELIDARKLLLNYNLKDYSHRSLRN